MDHSRRSSGTGFADDFDEFDLLLEDDDQPTTRVATAQPARAGRPATGRPGKAPKAAKAKRAAGAGRPSIRITPDWNRVAAVAFVVAVVLFIVWLAISSILGARREGAYKEYFKEVRQVATQSSDQGDGLEKILQDPEQGDRAQRVAALETLAGNADRLVKDANALEVPEQLVESHAWFVTSLEYRAAGLGAMQRSLSATADAKDQTASAAAIASAMTRLVASDVLWADSWAVSARSVLNQDEVDGVTVPDSVFVEDLENVSPKGIAKMLDRLASTPTATPEGTQEVPDDGKIRGGQLESGSITVAPSGQTLVAGQLTEIQGGDNVTFEVPFTNQGEVQLTQVPVKIVLRGAESDPMTLTGMIEVVDPGQTATAQVALDEIPNFGEQLEVDVLVGPIPGEKTADNNRGSYQLQFAL